MARFAPAERLSDQEREQALAYLQALLSRRVVPRPRQADILRQRRAAAAIAEPSTAASAPEGQATVMLPASPAPATAPAPVTPTAHGAPTSLAVRNGAPLTSTQAATPTENRRRVAAAAAPSRARVTQLAVEPAAGRPHGARPRRAAAPPPTERPNTSPVPPPRQAHDIWFTHAGRLAEWRGAHPTRWPAPGTAPQLARWLAAQRSALAGTNGRRLDARRVDWLDANLPGWRRSTRP